MRKIFIGIVCGMFFTACGPSQEEIRKMIAEVPLAKQCSLVLDYDNKLLYNIDSLFVSGNTMETAISTGHDVTWQYFYERMPSEWKGEEYVIKNECRKQWHASRKAITVTSMSIQTIVTDNNVSVIRVPDVSTEYVFRPEYRDCLAKEIEDKTSKSL